MSDPLNVRLRKASSAVFLATDAAVAEDLSSLLKEAAGVIEHLREYTHSGVEYALEVGYDDETEGVMFEQAFEDMSGPLMLMQHISGARLVQRNWSQTDWVPVPLEEIE